jgi:hypothetical protein
MRAWSAAGLVLVFAVQLVTRLVHDLNARPGDPDLSELLAALGADSRDLLPADLTAAERTARDEGFRHVSLPETWLSGPSGRRPPTSLMVFVDGRRVAFSREDPPAEPAAGGEPYAAYRFLRQRVRVLAIHCPPAIACREAVAAREGPSLSLAIARARLRRSPQRALASLASLAVFGVLAWRVAASWRPAQAAIGAAAAVAALAVWLGLGLSSRPQSRLVLGLEALALAAPLLLAAARTAREAWRGGVSPRLDRSAERASEALQRAGAARWGATACMLAAASLFLPTAVRDRTFFIDWANHLYLVSRQAESLRALHHPSYFLHSDLSGAFYPHYAFYGGTLYALTAALGILIGSVPLGYALSFGAGFAMAYGGAAWSARLAGLRGALAHLPALVLVGSAYYLTNAYGRGSWAEFVATSSLPLVIASGASLLLAERARPRDAALCFASLVLFSGSHSITLVWGGLFLALLALAMAWALRDAVAIRRGRLVLLLSLCLLGFGANAWFLAPALAYGRSTHIGGYAARGFGSDTLFLNQPSVVFHPGRVVPAQSTTPELYVQVSVYALAWALAAAATFVRLPAGADDRSRRLRRASLALLALLGWYSLLIGSGRLDLAWTLLPRLLKIVQFHFRLHTYVTFCIVGLVVLGLRAALASRRAASWLLALIAAAGAQLALAEYQAWSAATYHPRAEIAGAGATVPVTLQEAHDYRFSSHPDAIYLGETVLPKPSASLTADPAAVVRDSLALAVPGELGKGPILTNVVHSPFIQAAGDLAIAGRTREGWLVLDPRCRGAARPCVGTIQTARPWPVKVGTAVSLLSLLAAALLLAWTALGYARRV